MVETTQKLNIKDFAYYACKAQVMVASEKAFVNIVSRNVKEYQSPGDEDDVSTWRNMVLMARKTIECDEGYWSSGLEGDVEPKFCDMATNDPPGKSIIQQVKSI